MKEFLFVIWDISKDCTKFIKVNAINEGEAKSKFAKAFVPYLDFEYSDVEYMIENEEDVRIYCSELKDVIVI